MTVDSTNATPVLRGAEVWELNDAQVAAVFTDVFGDRRRCAALDKLDPRPEGERGPQWLLAELGDARLTGGCPDGTWRIESSQKEPGSGPLAADRSDAWRLLELTVFTEHTQIRIGEGAAVAHAARDTADAATLPRWLQPRDRSFLLLGVTRQRRYTVVLDGDLPMTRGRELSGSVALHPVRWQEFDVLRGRDVPKGKRGPYSKGSWLRVREYWAEHPTTGAVHVAFHRLTGYTTGPKPTDPLVASAPSALDEGLGEGPEEGVEQ